MARPGRVGRGGRDRREEEAVEAAPLMTTQDMTALNFAEPPRQSRAGRGRTGGGKSGGGSFIGTIVPLAAGFVAAIVTAIAGVVLAGGKPEGDPGADQMSANAAILLASTEPDWWEPKAGILPTLGELFKARYEEMRDKMKRNEDTAEDDLEALRLDYEAAIAKWDIKPAGEREADVARTLSSANVARLQKIVQGALPGSTVLWAAVVKGQNQIVVSSGQSPSVAGYLPEQVFGSVKVTPVQLQMASGILAARVVEAPMTDRFGQVAGKVRLILTAPAQPASGGAAMAAVFALVALIVVGGATFAMCAGVSGGLKRVTRDIDQIAQGDLDVRITAHGGGEVTAVAKAVDRAMKTFRAVQEQTVAAAAAAQHAVVATEQIDAVSLLPAEPPKVDGFELEAVHKPCPSKGNDFYDYIRVDDERIGVVVAEMPQRGSKGAFIAATFRGLMRAFAPGEQSPAAVLAKVNRIMASELKRGDHIKAMYTVLDVPKSIVSVASAGHLPLIFWKLAKKASALLSPEGIAIGLDKGPVFEKTVVDKRIKMEKGDRFVLHTDGPVAAKNIEGEEYGEQRFYYLVNREAPKNSAAFVNFVANEVDLFHGGAQQEDDISIVTVRKIAD